jgi:uridine kinase
LTVNLLEINGDLVRDPAAFASASGAAYEERITSVAKDIYAHRAENPVILISGPSGSGKTTTALKLERLLDGWGCETHTLSMDNYFLPFTPEEQRMAAEGLIDLESPARVDVDFLNAQLAEMIAGRTVSLPKYDFVNSARVFPGTELKRKPGELVIVEGIHALNHEVVTIPQERTARLYVSVRTRVTDGDTVLHPSKIRLMRRMVRDRLHRNRSVRETMNLFENVERGEQKYILPHKHRATHQIDTFFPYEINVYKPMLLRDLSELDEEKLERIADLMRIVNKAAPMREKDVPPDAMIREFIGNGEFQY